MRLEPEITFGFLSAYLNIEDACGCINILTVVRWDVLLVKFLRVLSSWQTEFHF